MRALNFYVTMFDADDAPTSCCMFPTERAARNRYHKAVASAACANVSRIRLAHYAHVLAEWWASPKPEEPDIQTAGYIVQSIRTLDKRSNVDPVGGEFFDNDADAIEYAESLASRWSVRNPGLIVFKAIKHVKKVEWTPRPGTRIRVFGV